MKSLREWLLAERNTPGRYELVSRSDLAEKVGKSKNNLWSTVRKAMRSGVLCRIVPFGHGPGTSRMRPVPLGVDAIHQVKDVTDYSNLSGEVKYFIKFGEELPNALCQREDLKHRVVDAGLTAWILAGLGPHARIGEGITFLDVGPSKSSPSVRMSIVADEFQIQRREKFERTLEDRLRQVLTWSAEVTRNVTPNDLETSGQLRSDARPGESCPECEDRLDAIDESRKWCFHAKLPGRRALKRW